MKLVAKTYWQGSPVHFRRPPRDAAAEPLVLHAHDGAELRGLWWTPKNNPNPRVAVLAMHPRADFTQHYIFPALLDAGYGCLGANTRSPNNDSATLHEVILLDVAAAVRFLKRRGVEKVLFIGNSGGGSLGAFYQNQAKLAPAERLSHAPGGRRVPLRDAEMPAFDAMIFLAAHLGEGHMLLDLVDPAVVDEARPLLSDPDLDMYQARNGFRPPPEWSEYGPEFVTRYRAAQRARVARIDAAALAMLDEAKQAKKLNDDADFQKLPYDQRREVLRREAFQPMMTIYRTMANLAYVDRRIDPSNRPYGSILSERPDLMNFQLFGFGRLATPLAWLSTWSGLSSNATIERTALNITEPALVVNAGRDMDVFPKDARAIHHALASTDKTLEEFPDALHYFEAPWGSRDTSDLDALVGKLLPWVQSRLPL
ncbi:MAG: hypothetical protein J0H82_12260 [Alphaproteobacteria bacterium]|jgi:pimeloyl-ACP methyl ester carboxylesterase|nr:hypothetical protein [Alphaproteobacteria bacterium]